MAIRKSAEESFVLDGDRRAWFEKCGQALAAAGFGNVSPNSQLWQLSADYHKATVWGTILVTILPDTDHTRIVAKATANVDNVFALFRSPTQKVLDAFKAQLAA